MVGAQITEAYVRVLSRPAVRALVICTAALALLTAMAMTGRAASPANVGRIEGTVQLVASTDPPITSGAYPTRRVSRPDRRTSEIQNVIVFVKDAPRAATLPTKRMAMMQLNEAFAPRVLAITRGSTVDFPNWDPYFHNVFSLSRGANFDLGRFPRGQSRSQVFARPGLVKVYCHLHSHMTATIMVFDHPLFTVPKDHGAFALADVPAGEYRLSAWHERIGESAKSIVVEAGRTVRVEFTLPVETESQ